MPFEAKVICDSISPDGVRLTTMQLKYPRFIHSEVMTHRVFSRNAASSRAIPVAKMIEQVRNDPALPVFWGKNQPGMQAAEELEGVALNIARNEWHLAAGDACHRAERMADIGAHKQIVNRILESWQWMQTIVSATEWDNFFELRCHPDAQPEFQHLAQMMYGARHDSVPEILVPGQWHLPYVMDYERDTMKLLDKIKCSVARCARVSYLTHDGAHPDRDKDVALHDRLVAGEPIHASPAEHQATPDIYEPYEGWRRQALHGNFKAWCQYRGTLAMSLTNREHFLAEGAWA